MFPLGVAASSTALLQSMLLVQLLGFFHPERVRPPFCPQPKHARKNHAALPLSQLVCFCFLCPIANVAPR